MGKLFALLLTLACAASAQTIGAVVNVADVRSL
jgi:hypothetical protein